MFIQIPPILIAFIVLGIIATGSVLYFIDHWIRNRHVDRLGLPTSRHRRKKYFLD